MSNSQNQQNTKASDLKGINVVKIGGNVIDDPEALRAFLTDFAAMPGAKVLVHGGGKEATRLGQDLNIPVQMVDGRRITSAETLRVVTMVYAGLINKRIVSLLQSMGCNALGLSGADANVIPATRRPATPIDFGFVGDIDPAKVSDSFIATLLSAGITPVFCAVCHDGAGTMLNCNADSVAGAVARASRRIAPVTLTYCFEKDGVMTDVDDPTTVIPEVDAAMFADLRARGLVAKGMVPKLQNALECATAGVDVRICRAEALNIPQAGTRIKA